MRHPLPGDRREVVGVRRTAPEATVSRAVAGMFAAQRKSAATNRRAYAQCARLTTSTVAGRLDVDRIALTVLLLRAIDDARQDVLMASTTVELTSILTCPACGHAEPLVMPTNACVCAHVCGSCQAFIRPKPNDCCVFCSYGSVRCPPVQTGDACCALDSSPSTRDPESAAAPKPAS